MLSRVTLEVVVVGASIAGLATAFTLQRAGHNVLVVESQSGRQMTSFSGIRSPPNMTRIFEHWGLSSRFDKICHKSDRFNLLKGGKFLGSILLSGTFLEDLLADFVHIQYSELVALLRQLAEEAGVRFLFDNKVVGIEGENLPVSIRLENGQSLSADFVVVADGYNSSLRSLVTEDVMEKKRRMILAFTIPRELMAADDDLRRLLDHPNHWLVWLADGILMNGNLTSPKGDFTATITYDIDPMLYPSAANTGWHVTTLSEVQSLDLSRLDLIGQKLTKAAKQMFYNVLDLRSHLDELVCDNERVALVGEAAHPLMIAGLYSTALCLEDAETLGCLFKRIQDKDQIPRLLNAYDELRQPRCAAVKKHEDENYDMLSLPDGPMQQQRDHIIEFCLAKEDSVTMSEEGFMQLWGEDIRIMSFDATDSVEDWWVKWGRILTQPNDPSNSVELTKSMQPELKVRVVVADHPPFRASRSPSEQA